MPQADAVWNPWPGTQLDKAALTLPGPYDGHAGPSAGHLSVNLPYLLSHCVTGDQDGGRLLLREDVT